MPSWIVGLTRDRSTGDMAFEDIGAEQEPTTGLMKFVVAIEQMESKARQELDERDGMIDVDGEFDCSLPR